MPALVCVAAHQAHPWRPCRVGVFCQTAVSTKHKCNFAGLQSLKQADDSQLLLLLSRDRAFALFEPRDHTQQQALSKGYRLFESTSIWKRVSFPSLFPLLHGYQSKVSLTMSPSAGR